MSVTQLGALLFGVVIGWITYRTLRRTNETVAISNIASVIGAVGGGAVTGLFEDAVMFAWYSIGLAVGFFLYMLLGHTVFKRSAWLGSGD